MKIIQERLDLLGFVLTNEGKLLTSEAKIKTIENLQPPVVPTLKTIRSMVGQINFIN